MIIGYIKGQELEIIQNTIVSDSIDYLTAEFNFSTNEWDGFIKWAHFKKDDIVYDVLLADDKILKSQHLNLSAGVWEVYVHGNKSGGTERITTNIVKLTVEPTGALNGGPLPEIPLEVAEQIMATIGSLDDLETTEKSNIVAAINEAAKTGGILNIEQTKTSSEDKGENEITISLADGKNFSFTFYNGSKGSKGDKGDPGTGGAAGVKGNVIDLEKYGIVQADFEYPFTTENYEVAYQNGVGFQNAINDAKANGIKELIVPEGNYPLCYSTDNYKTVNAIINIEGVDLVGYGAKLYVIYDELDTGLNPYYTGDIAFAHAMCGVVIKTDSDVEGFEIVGERGYRTTDKAKYRSSSYGIIFTNMTSGNKVSNCKIHRFSGDGISGGEIRKQIATWEHDMTHTTWNGREWVTSAIAFTTARMGIYWADITKPMQLGGKGYYYRIWSTQPLKIHCFAGTETEEGAFIGTVLVRQGEPFYFMEGTYYWYLETTDSVETDLGTTIPIGISLGYGTHNNSTIENCEIFANTRGGISNLPSSSTIKDCVIHHNGCAFDGMIAFYDGTQFGLDIEDVYIHEITIDNCLFYGQLHDILYRCDKINILNTVTKSTVKSLAQTVDFYARNSKFYGKVSMNGGANYGKRTAVGCYFAKGEPSDVMISDTPQPVSANISPNDGNVVLFKDSSGNVLFSLDLTLLGKNLGDYFIKDALLFNFDSEKASADSLTMNDETGNVAVTIKDANTITKEGIGGIATIGKWKSSLSCVWNNVPSFNEEFAVEILCTDYARYAWGELPGGLMACKISAGTNLYSPHTFATLPFEYFSSFAPYINTSGETMKVSGYTDGRRTLENGKTIQVNDYNYPDLNSEEYRHIVFNFHKDGTITAFGNGIKLNSTLATTDFVAWDTSGLSSGFSMWGHNPTNTSSYVISKAYLLKMARMYNRCLKDDEVKANFAYESKKLGKVYTVAYTLTNSSVDHAIKSVKKNNMYIATLTANSGYNLSTVTVTMGDVDITSDVYADGVITIPSVTGNVVITATATATT